MKYVSIIIFAVLLLSFFINCQNQQSNPDNHIIPPVSNVQVTNIPGGARLSYNLPDSDSLQYIKAVYPLADGTQKEIRGSFYQTDLTVHGLPDTNAVKVQLKAVSRGGTVSKPVSVTIHPLLPPARFVARTLKMEPTSGGLRISFANPTDSDMKLTLLREDSVGASRLHSTYYSSDSTAAYLVDTSPAATRAVGAVLEDQYNVRSDTLYVRLDSLSWEGIDRLQNHIFPIQFARFDGRRWGTPAGWEINEAVKSRGTYGGVDAHFVSGGGYFAIENWKQEALRDGKIAQTVTLPAGRYSFDGYFQQKEAFKAGFIIQDNSSAQLVVAKGRGLPDVENLNTALSYSKLEDPQVAFTLQEQARVTVGFVANYIQPKNYFRCPSVSLRRLDD